MLQHLKGYQRSIRLTVKMNRQRLVPLRAGVKCGEVPTRKMPGKKEVQGVTLQFT